MTQPHPDRSPWLAPSPQIIADHVVAQVTHADATPRAGRTGAWIAANTYSAMNAHSHAQPGSMGCRRYRPQRPRHRHRSPGFAASPCSTRATSIRGCLEDIRPSATATARRVVGKLDGQVVNVTPAWRRGAAGIPYAQCITRTPVRAIRVSLQRQRTGHLGVGPG